MGVVKIKRPEQTLWERVYLFEVLRGMAITIKHAILSFFTPAHRPTFEYPEVKRPVAERFRGRHELRRRADGTPKCVACYCCQTVCPSLAIDIVAEEVDDPAVEKRPQQFDINMVRCIFCGMCVEACPKDAITLTQQYELANQTREQLQYRLEDLLEPRDGKKGR
jgi:NADH-quinone oxidoreductase subunit I